MYIGSLYLELGRTKSRIGAGTISRLRPDLGLRVKSEESCNSLYRGRTQVDPHLVGWSARELNIQVLLSRVPEILRE